ncbi:hypothetical protein J6590_089298 [Homalodisca vitripennis]|nr:hypothetical protein J6590_089298 [Homalodisca vitripennis]
MIGEEMIVELTSSSKNGKIWLDTSEVHFKDTYMGLTNQKKVTLYNDSEVTIKYSWLKFGTVQEDLNELNKLKEGFEFVKVNETLRCNKLEYNDVMNENDHARVYSRICTDETQLLSTQDLLFSNKNFEIFPMEGVLWPGGRCDMTVVFKPQTAEYLCTEAFCDVAGRDNRLPLGLDGHGLGPLLELCFHSLDIGAVFLGAIQCYEIGKKLPEVNLAPGSDVIKLWDAGHPSALPKTPPCGTLVSHAH